MAQTITVIPGDGIGPEVTDATLTVLKAAGADLEYDMQQAGLLALQEQRTPLPKSTLESAEAVLDLTAAGHQPMCNEDETYWVVYNGEVYNFRELRRELEAAEPHRGRARLRCYADHW